MRIIFLFFLLFSLNNGLAQNYYYTGWDDANEQSGWTQIRKGDLSLYEWYYDTFSSLSPSSSLGHNYPVGGSTATDDWFVSPVLDFSFGGAVDSMYSKYSGFGTPMAGDTIALYLLDGNQDPDLANKTLIYNFTDSSYSNDDQWYKIQSFDIPLASSNCYLAFRYKTVVNWLDVRFDNFYVKSFIGSGIDHQTQEFKIYPNPTIEILFLSGSLNQEYEIFNLSGESIMQGTYVDLINVSSLKKGIYFVQVSNKKGISTKKFIKL